MLSKILAEAAGTEHVSVHEAHGNNLLTARGDDPLIKLNTDLFRLKADKILALHKLFRLLSPKSLITVMEHVVTLKLR